MSKKHTQHSRPINTPVSNKTSPTSTNRCKPYNPLAHTFVQRSFIIQPLRSAYVCVYTYYMNIFYLSIVVVSSAVLILHVLSSGCEEGQWIEVLVRGLLPTCHQLPIIK